MSEEKDNPLSMSDEDFMKNYGQEDSSSEPEEKEEEPKEESTEPEKEQTEDTDNKVEESNNEDSEVSESVSPSSGSESNVKDSNKTNQNNSDTIESNNEEPDYKSLYEKIMAPFKADGRTVKLKDANEAIALMQKGVNYTRKTQNLAKYQKSILSLENANLLDANKLNTLISISKGDKEAIKQLLKEHNIDPMDLSSNSYDDEEDKSSNYTPPNNMVDDQYVRFRGALDEIKDTKEGQELIKDLLNSDDQTKSEVYADPRVINILMEHKNNGIYDQVITEMQRRRAIGTLDGNTPFIYAYKQIGDELYTRPAQMQGAISSSGSARLRPTIQPQQSTNKKPKFTNNARARAAAPNRTSPAADKKFRNPLSMSDEEFMRIYRGRY